MLKNRPVIVLTILAAIGVTLYVVTGDKGGNNGSDEESEEFATNETSISDHAFVLSEESPLENGMSPADESEAAENIDLAISNWQQSSGYYVEKTHPYRSYDNQMLRTMAEADDLIANVMLGDRLLRSRSQQDRYEGVELHTNAAALGSTFSALTLGSEYLSSPFPGESSINEIEALAWFQVAMSRGDPGGASSINLATASKPPSLQTQQAVCDRAVEIRRSLERTRNEKFLREFDDTPPPMPIELQSDSMFKASFVCDLR